MKKSLLMAALAAAVVGGALGCGGKSAPPSSGTFTDTRDGKVYRIVQVGGQVWFAENLNYAAEGSMCYENSPDSCAKYGRLYDWATALKVCPAGSHLPSDGEWNVLVDYVGGEEKAGTKLKSSTGWNSKSGVPVGTDNYGFSALPNGYGVSVGSFDAAGYGGSWWSATEDYADGAWHRSIYYDFQNVGRHDGGKTVLFSVRCMADKEAQK